MDMASQANREAVVDSDATGEFLLRLAARHDIVCVKSEASAARRNGKNGEIGEGSLESCCELTRRILSMKSPPVSKAEFQGLLEALGMEDDIQIAEELHREYATEALVKQHEKKLAKLGRKMNHLSDKATSRFDELNHGKTGSEAVIPKGYHRKIKRSAKMAEASHRIHQQITEEVENACREG